MHSDSGADLDEHETCVGEKRKYADVDWIVESECESDDLEDTYSDESGDDSEDGFGDESEDVSARSIPKTKLNTPLEIGYERWVNHWTIKEALRDMVDQARTVAMEAGLDGQIEIDDKPKGLTIRVGARKLADATWKVETCKIIRKYSDTGKNKSCMKATKYDVVRTQVIELTNLDSALPWDAYRPGMTTKGGLIALVGKHGEGLTAACVVLMRLGCNLSSVCTRNGLKTTVGKQEDGLVFFQINRKKASTSARPDQPLNSVRFRIVLDPEEGGLTMDIRALMAQIRLPADVSASGVATSRGTLLLGDDYRGTQYNRSIFVADSENCLFGYDFHDPDKNMFQGRDRNSLKSSRLLVECGAILSEAIVTTPEVCHRVLQALKYPHDYRPGESKDELPRFDDLKEGNNLAPGAIQALRNAEALDQTSHQQTVFCAHVPPALQAIVEHRGLRVVLTHPVLHTHEAVVNDFYGALNINGQALSPELRVGAHQHRIAELLGVNRVMRSGVPHVSGHCTFWRRGAILYVTSPEQLGAVSTRGFTETQEVALYKTLLTCKAPEESVVRIMRLLREGHERDEARAVTTEHSADAVESHSSSSVESLGESDAIPTPTGTSTEPPTADTAEDTTSHATVSAPRLDTGTYTKHASSGMWLHGRSAPQHQELAELIEDSVQTEEGQRRLRRLSGQLYLVASVEQPHGLKK